MRTLLAVLLALGTASQVLGKVARIPFEELVRQSDLIVVAKVSSVTRPLIGKKYAKANVTEVWKGASQEAVRFLASPTWTCDSSTAQKGETFVLFLIEDKKTHAYQISGEGRGRMPIRTAGSKPYASFWSEIIFPKYIPTTDEPGFTQAVELVELRKLVNSSMQTGK